jgi:hypothetical protein
MQQRLKINKGRFVAFKALTCPHLARFEGMLKADEIYFAGQIEFSMTTMSVRNYSGPCDLPTGTVDSIMTIRLQE